ncbi:MAG: tetratricopeptide repeat protein [Synergistaceae bacterium]
MEEIKNKKDHLCPEFVEEEHVGVTEEETICAKRKRSPRPPVPKFIFYLLALVVVVAFTGGSFWYYHENVLPEKYFRKADVSFNRDNHEEALKYYLKVLKIRPERKDVLYKIAFCYEKEGKVNEAISYYNEHLKTAKKDTKALIRLGWLYMNNGRYVEALKAFEEATNKDKKSTEFWHLMSEAAEKANDRDKLTKALENSVKYAKDNDSAIAYAKKLMNIGVYDKALFAYETIIKNYPEDMRAVHGAKSAKIMMGCPVNDKLVIIPGASIGDVKIGLKKQELIKVVGRPTSKRFEKDNSNKVAEIWIYKNKDFAGKGLRVFFANNKVSEIETSSCEYKTERGLGLSNFLLEKNANNISSTDKLNDVTSLYSTDGGGLTFYVSHLDETGHDAKYKKLRVHAKDKKSILFDMIRKIND